MHPVKTILSILGASALAVSAQAVEVQLDWNDNGESDLSHYRVYRSTSSGSTGGRVADNVGASAWTDTSVNEGTTYYYRVSAVDTSGNESSKSSQVSAAIPDAPDQSAQISFTNPSSGATLSGTVAINATANDPDAGTGDGDGISGVRFELRSGGSVVASHQENLVPWDWNLDTTTVANGSYTLRAVATSTSGAGGGTTAREIPVTIDNASEPPPSSGDGAFIEAGGIVVMEAENFTATFQNGDDTNWRSATGASGYSGGGYVETPDNGIFNASWGNGAELSYELAIQTAGTYRIWLRRNATDGAANSAYVGADGSQVGTTFDNGGGSGWQWVEHGIGVVLDVGTHQFQLHRREDGYRVDKIVLTTDGGLTPSGTGPAESDRGEVEPPPPPPPSGDLVTNVIAASGKAYTLDSLATGNAVFIDRSYTVTSLGDAAWAGAEQIQTANDDKGATDSGFLTFDLSASATVYVAHDGRSPAPGWLGGWTDTGKQNGTSDVAFDVFAKTFPAGGVTLGGNGGASSMYWVFVLGDDAPPPSGGFAAKVNFQPDTAPTVSGYAVDSGATFGDRGNGLSYGWDQSVNATRDRNAHGDQRYDTLNHMQKGGDRSWEIAVPNGIYEVTVVCGDPGYTDQVNCLSIEGVTAADPDGEDHFDQHLEVVEVTDGRLTITPASGASNAKLCFIEIASTGTAN